jgi:ABC-type sugar transport system ATPase subunit
MAKVVLENVCKTFGAQEAVKDVNMEIEDGKFVCLLGPAGCGKTTTLRMIAGLETPTSGSIYIGDKKVEGLSPAERDIAMVFQFYAIYPGMTVYENLALPLKQKKMSGSEIDRIVKDTAQRLGIDSRLDDIATRITVGEKQRVAIGRAIVRRPKVYLLDEPLSNLEAGVRSMMRIELKRLQKDLGQTMIYVTHDQLEGISMADKIAVMNLGQIQQYDTPSQIYDYPSNTFVAGFVGTPTMNFLEGTLDDKRSTLQLGPFSLGIDRHLQQIRQHNASSELIMGIRPPDIAVEREKSAEDALEATIQIIEPIGERIIVDLLLGDITIKAITSRSFNPKMNEKVWVHIPQEKMRIFDKKTEKNIL